MCANVYKCTRISVFVDMYIYVYLCIYVFMYLCIYVFRYLCEMYSFGIFAVPSVMFRLNGVRISAKGTIQKHKN